MKITDVRAAQPEAASAPRDWRGSLGQLSVAVEAGGMVGYGMGAGGAAGIHVIHEELRRLLLGADAGDVEGLWEAMYRSTLAYGRKGLALMAISGVDLALWDLRGKAAGKPVAALLAEDPAAEVPAYSTTGLDGADGFEGIAEALRAGFGAVKLGGIAGSGAPDEGTADLLRRARERAGGGVQLMADAGMGWSDPARVLALCEEVADLGLVWLEEPLPSDDLDGYAWLTQRSPVPIAGGEHEFTARAFAELMDRGCHRIYQPDVCWCGGLTQLVEIYRLARDHGVRVCPHRGSEVWGLHAVAALDPEPLAESGRPWMEWVGGRELRGGRARWTGGPGFGVELPV